MRLDKFLKVSRLIKRRTVAKQLCDNGRIQINGNTAKAGTKVKRGDELVIRFGQKLVTACVTDIQETAKKEDAASMYEIIKEESLASQSE